MPVTDTSFTELNKELLEQKLSELTKGIRQKEDVQPGFAAVILAAGLGKRMNNPGMPKVMFRLCGRPLVQYVAELAVKAGPDLIIPVVGHRKELVVDFLNSFIPPELKSKLMFAFQDQQLGTGHAVMQTEGMLKDFKGNVLILSGDVPLLRLETVQRLIDEHLKNGRDATLLTAMFGSPAGYGRIVRDGDGRFMKIVEDRDATEEEKKISEINPAIYILKSNVLFEALRRITPDNDQKEYYLTDIFHFIPKEKVGTVVVEDETEVTGINSIEQLEELERQLRV